VRPANPDVEAALLEDRVSITFGRSRSGQIQVDAVMSQKGHYQFDTSDFVLALKATAFDKYWLDTGVFEVRYG
jgi:hypothetical protein